MDEKDDCEILPASASEDEREDELERYLAAKGIISLPEVSDETREDAQRWEPVEVTGQPISEMIIEERR